MSEHYSDPTRADDPHALPDIEVFYHDSNDPDGVGNGCADDTLESGWYYWFCFPGCLPDSDPVGPFETEQAAVNAAQEDGQ